MVTFEELSNCFPTCLQHFAFPQETCEGSNSPTCSSVTLAVICLFDYSQPSGCGAASLGISLTTDNVERLFTCLLSIRNVFFGEMPVQVLCPFLKCVICLFIVEL